MAPKFRVIALGLGLAFGTTACNSTPTFCECKENLVKEMAETFKNAMEEGKEMDTTRLQEMADKCEEAYGDLTLAEKAEELKKCE